MTEEKYNELRSKPEWNIFYNVVKGVNFVTPKILDLITINNHIIEISTNINTNIIGKIYGITVITKDNNGNYHKNDDLSKSVNSYKKVEQYLKELKNEK